jgi:restriction system protein
MIEIIALAVFSALGYLAGRYRVDQLQNTGEALVARTLQTTFAPPDYHLLNNVTLPVHDGSTQVDHVLVSRFGVFVIETKHYQGWLFGAADSATWTQVLYRRKFKFQNPIRQNYKHVKAVQSLLDFLPPEHVRSAVVFSGEAEFRTPRPAGVFSVRGLAEHLGEFKDEVLSHNRMQFCVGRIECQRLALTRETDVQHRSSLQRRFGDLH